LLSLGRADSPTLPSRQIAADREGARARDRKI